MEKEEAIKILQKAELIFGWVSFSKTTGKYIKLDKASTIERISSCEYGDIIEMKYSDFDIIFIG